MAKLIALIALLSLAGLIAAFYIAHASPAIDDRVAWEAHLQHDSSLFMWIVGTALACIGALIGIIYATVRKDLDGKRTIKVCDEIKIGHCQLIEEARQSAEDSRNDMKTALMELKGDIKEDLKEVKDRLSVIEYWIKSPFDRDDKG
jgi:H+/Cl- antiporter ClcA